MAAVSAVLGGGLKLFCPRFGGRDIHLSVKDLFRVAGFCYCSEMTAPVGL
jgi:hypothetical protein